MIRFSQDSDLPALYALWQEAFEADAREAEYFFSRRLRREYTLVALDEGRVLGMLSMLPISLVVSGKSYPARYVFAVATLRQFRGQGLSSQLLDAAHQHMTVSGEAASVLVPARPSLFDFYGKRGYETRFFIDSLNISSREIPVHPPAAQLASIGAEDYLRLRDGAFGQSSLYVRWDLEALRFFISSLFGAGGALRIVTPQGEAACLYELRDGGARVTELALHGLGWQDAMAAIHGYLGAPAYTLRMPAGTLPGAPTQPFGMIRWLAPAPEMQGGAPYLSIAKD
ncbi:MAG: GNAT family N-acetyltransferase [Eubacteriales bacterium]|nr:GNAT family N-acetyltransferase [Eubacteriales bacterium]